jgi:hypothetical protein
VYPPGTLEYEITAPFTASHSSEGNPSVRSNDGTGTYYRWPLGRYRSITRALEHESSTLHTSRRRFGQPYCFAPSQRPGPVWNGRAISRHPDRDLTRSKINNRSPDKEVRNRARRSRSDVPREVPGDVRKSRTSPFGKPFGSAWCHLRSRRNPIDCLSFFGLISLACYSGPGSWTGIRRNAQSTTQRFGRPSVAMTARTTLSLTRRSPRLVSVFPAFIPRNWACH